MRAVGRALGAGAVLAAVALGATPPAHAAPPVVEWRTPTVDQKFDADAFTLDATARKTDGGSLRNNATVTFVSPEGHPVPAPTDHATDHQASKVITQPVTLPWNGPYTVRITVSWRENSLASTQTSTYDRNFVVEAAPDPPTGVRTSVDSQTRKVTVSWTPNGEPDMVGYEVQRQLGAGDWEQVTLAGKSTTTVLDSATASQGGTYAYRVVALREAAAAGKGIPSGPSSTSTARVPAPPVTTTTTTTSTTTPDDEPGNGTAGGTSGGSAPPSRTGTTTKGGAGTSTSSGGRGAPVLATTGTVDLSGFATLLEQARAAGTSAPELAAGEDDGTYDERLPFASGRARADDESEDEFGDGPAVIGSPVGDDTGDRLQSMAFLAGGLLATVLLMHVLWVRSELHRAEALEALAVDAGDDPAADAVAAHPVPVDVWSRHVAAALVRFHARPPRPRARPSASSSPRRRDAL